MTAAAKDLKRVIGRSPESLTLEESLACAGQFIAIELYSPATLPLKRIEAIGGSAAACIEQLRARGLDPTMFEFSRLPHPYSG